MSRRRADALEGWSRSSFTAGSRTHDVFRRGEGPGVVVVHELPGITPAVRSFADEVVDAGFTVAMPSLVGRPGRPPSLPAYLAATARICISREFTTWALERTSPVVAWLRSLARTLHGELGGPGVGAVGMCFSGGFALGMMVDRTTVAPVLAQPSLPFAAGRDPRRAADVGLSPDDRELVARRAEEGCAVLGLHYSDDRLVGNRFPALHDLLGESFVEVELPSRSRRDHSVLTEQRDDGAVGTVIEFLRGSLLPPH